MTAPSISEKRRLLLEKLLQKEGIAVPMRRIPRRAETGPAPLSFTQQRLWFLQRLDPESASYNIPRSVRLAGALDIAVLERSLAEIVCRHEALRTVFTEISGEPAQMVVPPLPSLLSLTDLSGLQTGKGEKELAWHLKREGARPFDLARGPVIRFSLFRLRENDHVLALVVHHVAADAWSLDVLFGELAALYASFLRGEGSPLPALPVQYADYAVWQRQWLTGRVFEDLLGTWLNRLAGVPKVLELPVDRPRPPVWVSQGGVVAFDVGREATAAIRALAHEGKATLFIALLAAFQALLHRWSGQNDFVVGSPVAGRNRQELELLIGAFINTLALRADFAGEPDFRTALARTREVVQEAHSAQDLPFERLVHALDLERDLSHSPLFQVLFLQQEVRRARQELPGLSLENLEVNSGGAQLDLTLMLADTGSTLLGSLSFRRDLFDETTVQRLAGHFAVLLSAAALAPSTPVSELPLLSPGERHQVLREWNDTATPRSGGLCLHALIAAQAERAPDAVAVCCAGEWLTFRELVSRSRKLARHLRALGVEQDGLVGVLLERSVEMIVGLLGVLEAGAAYVPLDPGLPAERLGALVESSGLAVILSRETHCTSVPVPGKRVVLLDAGWRAVEELQGASPSVPAEELNLAYVLYTSGSTGVPKGVMISHQGIVNRLLWMQEAYGLVAEDRVLQKTPFGFDVSLWELFWPLLTGARLVFAQPEGHKDPQYLVDLIAREGVTTLHFVPSMLEAFLEVRNLASLTVLRRVFASGEALPPQLVRRFFTRLVHAELHNLYGPTEASVDVSAWPCVSEPPGSLVPIGRPIANHRLCVVDRHVAPQPVGVPGELLLGGPGLARGYLGQPDLTAEAFIPDPLGGAPGGRLYRTGDLVRLLPDGNVHFLGRIDHQVKVRGFRIELGEIESMLARHPSVRAAVVLLRQDLAGGAGLVAYVVADEETQPALSLRRWLEERLPGYMVPVFFVRLEALPLNPNGKVDRKALPAPEVDSRTASFTAPRNSFEEALARIWADLLGLARPGIDSSFFALGGDSIQAVRLVSRMNEELGLNFKVQDVFQHQTIAALAAQSASIAGRTSVEQERAAGLQDIERFCRVILSDPQQRAGLPDEYEDFFPLSGIEKGMVYYSLLLPEEPVYHDQFVYLLPIADSAAFFEALRLTMERHPIFRTSFHVYAFAEPVKVVHRELHLEEEVEDLSSLTRPEQQRRIEEYRSSDVANRFRFDGEVLWRFKLFRLREALHYAILTFHHSMLDGWSCVSFWVEVNNLYARHDRRNALPPLASSYKDFLAITLGRKRSEETAAFWRETLDGVTRNKLPFNRIKIHRPQARGMGIVQRRLGGELLVALRALALAHHISLRTLMLAAHVWLLHVLAREDEVVTGVVTHERPEIKDGDKILGCFLNTIPVRIYAAGTPGVAPLLSAVDGYLRRAREHEVLLEDIVTATGHRETGDNPFFDTIFNFIDFHILAEAEPHGRSGASLSPGSEEQYDLEAKEMTNTLFDLEVMATLGELTVKVKYSPRYFDAADAWRAADLFGRLLERITGDAAARLDSEALLSATERSEVIDGFNDTRKDYPRETPLFRLIEARVRDFSERPAVSCVGESLTYGELNRAANRLARYLLRQGARPGDNIGVIHPRSLELAVALMAVLKMGGAYVPIEPDYPPARKGYIVRNSGVTRVVADRRYELSGAEALFVLPDPSTLLVETGSDLDVDPRPDQLAYTIYTSGSTGRPKGVMIEHHSAVNLVQWVNRELAIGPQSTVLMLSSVCFDLSVYDLFGGLSAGARVVVAREEDLQDPERLRRLLTEEKVTFWSSVPSTMGLLTRYLEDAAPAYRQEDLTAVFLSGDWIPLSLPEKIRRFFPNARILSLGGATEGTVWSIFYPVGRVDETWASIPYGRPIDNNTFYILDKCLSVVPPGVVGDLYIGGVGVAKGYANDPEKTAASFLPDRFAVGPGARMYRTGDLGRMLPGGNIEFLGRADHQVKVRGFRVELGEVESQLLKHPSVREAVVVDKVDSSGERYLCAYAVAATELPAPSELKAYLAATLPDYMIPVAFVPLSALPLTGNGKLDRRALPDPEVANLSTSARYVEPVGEVEVALVEIWHEILGIDGIGTRHDFFELGGHSLRAVQVITRIRRRLGVELPLRILFDTPTVAGLAAQIDALRRRDALPKGTPLGRTGRSGPPPLSFAQQRLWFLDQLDPGRSVYNIPATMTLTGPLDVKVLAAALGEVMQRHEVLRTTFRSLAGELTQIIAPRASVALPVIDLQCLPEAARAGEAERHSAAAAERPFDLGRGPLLRSVLLRFEPEHHAILLTMHHIVSDGWSMGILVRELRTLYEAFLEGRPSPLPALPVQYADFALWQREFLQGETLAEQLGYWTRHLDGAPPLLALPYDRPRPLQPSYRGSAHRLCIPPEVTSSLKALGRSEGATLFMTLLAAWSILLYRYSGEPEIVIGSSIANRHQLNLEGLIGLFVNTVALRISLAEEPTVRELLAQVREVVLGAQAHQDFPFEKLVEALRPGRDPGYHPIFQVALVMQDNPVEPFAVSIDPNPVRLERQSAKYDLSLFVTEEADVMTVVLEYNADLFEADTTAGLASQFAAVLAALPSSAHQPISAVRFLPAAEEAYLLEALSEDLEL